MDTTNSLSAASTNMKTEEDTFKVLKRPSVHEMRTLHSEWKNRWILSHPDPAGGYKVYPSTQNLEFVKHYDWDWVEYLMALKELGLWQ